MGCRFGTGEGGKNHSILTTQKLDYATAHMMPYMQCHACVIQILVEYRL